MTRGEAREAPARFSIRDRRFAALLVAAAAALVFLPTLRGAILDYDDRFWLLPSRIATTWAALRSSLTSPCAGNYVPVAALTFMLDAALWGGRSWGYHLTNVALHAANAGLLFVLILDLLGADSPRAEDGAAAAFGALFFALHPLRVESVAWIAERRDVLCGFFCLLTLLCWVRAARADGEPERRLRAGALAAFVLALFSKPAALPLPLALAILDARCPRRLTPFFVLSAAAAIVAVAAQSGVGAVQGLARVPVAERVAQAALGLTFYLGKTLWPAHLALYERRWDLLLPAAFLGTVALAALGAAAYCVPRLRAPFAKAAAFHSAMLVPTLGVVVYGHELVADRYSYLPSFATAALAALGFRALARRRARAAAAAGLLVLAALAAASVRQMGMWRDETSLWRWELRADPFSWAARGNLAKALIDAGRDGEALLLLEEHLRLYPDSPKAVVERDKLAARLGDSPRVRARIHEALGREFFARGEFVPAAWHYRKALALDPTLDGLGAELDAALRGTAGGGAR